MENEAAPASGETGLERIYVSLSSEAQTLLTNNEINLVKSINRELKGQQLTVEMAYGAPPVTGDERTKDVVLIILASAAATALISTAITRIINSIGDNRKVLVTEGQWEPIVGPNDQLVLNKEGAPIFQWVEKHIWVQPERSTQKQGSTEVVVGAEKGLSIKLSDS